MDVEKRKETLRCDVTIVKRGLIFDKWKMLRLEAYPAPNFDAKGYERKTGARFENPYVVKATELDHGLDGSSSARIFTALVDLRSDDNLEKISLSKLGVFYKGWLRVWDQADSAT